MTLKKKKNSFGREAFYGRSDVDNQAIFFFGLTSVLVSFYHLYYAIIAAVTSLSFGKFPLLYINCAVTLRSV